MRQYMNAAAPMATSSNSSRTPNTFFMLFWTSARSEPVEPRAKPLVLRQAQDERCTKPSDVTSLCPSFSVEVILQDDRGRGRVELLFALPPITLADREAALGLAARQSLVFRGNGDRGAGRQRRDECGDARRLARRRAVQPRRHPDDDGAEAIVLVSELSNPAGHAVHRVGAARHCDDLERACQRARDVADREAYAARADIDGQDPSIHQFTNSPIHQFTNSPIHQPTKWYSFF